MKTKKLKPIYLVTNKYGSAMIYVDENSFTTATDGTLGEYIKELDY